MGVNTETLKLKEKITEVVNNSQLPPVNVLLVLECIVMQVNGFVEKSIQYENGLKEKAEENGDQIINNS